MICGKDCDDVFAYDTIKIVRVRDRHLGLMRLAAQLAIFLYIIIYVMILQKKFVFV